MAQVWDEQLMWARYHLSVALRLLENFVNYETKRFLSGTINEMALSATGLVNSLLIFFNVKEGAKIPKNANERISKFKRLGEKSFGGGFVKNIIDIFNIKRAQKNSPVEILKGDKILLLDGGEYRALTTARIKGMVAGLEIGIKAFEDFSKEL